MRRLYFRGTIFTLGLIFFLFFFHLQLWGGQLAEKNIKSLLLTGIEQGLNLQEKEAIATIKKAIAEDRENPLSYSLLAMAYLFFYETSFAEKEKNEKGELLLATIATAQRLAEIKIIKFPQEAEPYLALAIARMVRNRWEIIHKNYFRAFREGQNVWNLLQKVQELDPSNYEVYYPLGVLHYHLAYLPGAARWLSSLFITAADPEKGIKELELAANKSYFLQDLAKANLVSIYSGYEKQPEKALSLAQGLKKKYPQNYNFSFALANIFSELGEDKEAFSIAREIERNITFPNPPYRPELWPRYYQLLGKIHFDQGDYDKAKHFFNLALQDEAPYNARVRAWALVRLGMLHDLRQERNLAQEFYRKALQVEGAEGLAQRAAKEYLNAPYTLPPKINRHPIRVSSKN